MSLHSLVTPELINEVKVLIGKDREAGRPPYSLLIRQLEPQFTSYMEKTAKNYAKKAMKVMDKIKLDPTLKHDMQQALEICIAEHLTDMALLGFMISEKARRADFDTWITGAMGSNVPPAN